LIPASRGIRLFWNSPGHPCTRLSIKGQSLVKLAMKALEQNIVIRATQSGDERYIVRIRDIREPSGLWYNQTFKSLEIAREVRDEQLAKQEEDRKAKGFKSRRKKIY